MNILQAKQYVPNLPKITDADISNMNIMLNILFDNLLTDLIQRRKIMFVLLLLLFAIIIIITSFVLNLLSFSIIYEFFFRRNIQQLEKTLDSVKYAHRWLKELISRINGDYKKAEKKLFALR